MACLARRVALLLIVFSSAVVDLLPRVVGEQCPTLAAQAGGDPTSLDLSHFSAYVDTSDVASDETSGSGSGGLVELIDLGEVSPTFSSASSAAELDDPRSPIFPASNTQLSIRLHLNSTAPAVVYYLFNIWSLNTTVAPTGCPATKEGQIRPGEEFVNKVDLSCEREGEVVIQGCLTLGTAPFDTLNGTYKTLEFYIRSQCEGSSANMCNEVTPQSEVIPGELCLTLNQSQQLVTNPAGSWGVLLGPLRPNPSDPLRGYCVVDVGVAGGLATFAADPDLRPQFPIAELFPGVEMYLSLVAGTTALAFSILFTSTNTTILEPPYIEPITAGVVVEKETIIYLNLPCVGPGVVEVISVINMSTVLDETLYFQSYVSSIYRNCTPEDTTNSTIPSLHPETNTLQIRLLASLLPALLLLLITVTAVLVMVLLTRRIIRKETVTLQRMQSMDDLSGNNAYQMKTVKTPFESLKELDMEYNYPSLEVVSELGEGAFGRVFKARAPGLKRHGFVPEFVAVKTLKDADFMSEEFCKEVKAVVRFNHPHIVRLLAVCSTSTQKCMIFEYMDLGGLDDLLRRSDPDNKAAEDDKKEGSVLLTPSVFLSCSLQVARGVAYLAELKYIHRDIASRNCLVNHNLVVKIGDFGMSRDLGSMDYYRVGGTQACLPVRWMPPEALLFGKFTTQSDVWSFGVLMWEIYAFGRRPYTGLSNHEVIDAIKASRILECPKLCPASVYDVMKICWTRSPLKRPNMDVVVGRLERLLPSREDEREGGRAGKEVGPGVVYINLEYGAEVKKEELEESARVEREMSNDRTSEGPANLVMKDLSEGEKVESHIPQNSASSDDMMYRDGGKVHTLDETATVKMGEPAAGRCQEAEGDSETPEDYTLMAQDSKEPDDLSNDDEVTTIIIQRD